MHRHRLVAAAVLALLWMAGPAGADDIEKWFERIDFGGDLRLRYEGFSKDGSFADDRRDRFRIRLRAGLEIAVTDALTVGMQLRNGDPDDPVSNNTSFDGGFQSKEFNLSQGYLDFRVNDRLAVVGGKFDAGKRWTVSDLQWDDDVTVEGAMETYAVPGGGSVFGGLDVVGYQLILEESSSAADAYLFGGQLRADLDPGEDIRLAVGGGFDYWDNPQAVVDLTLDGKLAGNSVTNLLDADGRLVSEFEILNLFAEVRFTRPERWPVKLNLFYYSNLGAAGAGADEDSGSFVRLQVGDYKKKGHVAFRYSRYDSEPDALFYVFAQSDTSRGSDVEAHRFDVRIGCVARSYVNLTWYRTEPTSFEDETLDRWQVDYIVRF